MKKTVTPLDCEQPFKLNELFFSTTDLRGVITAGNQVFVDISKYSVEELLGAPHNIIRHPEMPRAVFRLLWRYLEANKIIVAYVKNMAANGNYYWVLALVYPLEDGYISIRFKPSSKYFSVVQNLYTEMKEIEKRVGVKGDEKAKGMDESTDFLIEKLCTLGFASYDEFMTEVLKEELSSRDRMLKKEDLSLLPTIASDLINSSVYGNNFMLVSELFTIYLNFYSSYTKLNDFFDKIEVFNQLNSQITLKADNIFDLAKDFRFISLNTAIQSEKLGNNSNTLSVVASNMEESSKHVLANIDDLKAEVARFRLYMEQLVFDISASKLQIEMMLFFIYEVIESLKLENMGEKDSKQIIDSFRERFTVLSKSFQISYQNITKSLHEIQNKTLTLIDVTNFLNQKVISLKFGQIEGLIEANRINQGSSFGVVFKDINRQLDRVRDEYSGLNLNIQEIKSMIVDAPYKLDYISGSFEKSIEKMNNLS